MNVASATAPEWRSRRQCRRPAWPTRRLSSRGRARLTVRYCSECRETDRRQTHAIARLPGPDLRYRGVNMNRTLKTLYNQFNRILFLLASGSSIHVIMLYSLCRIRRSFGNYKTYKRGQAKATSSGSMFSANISWHWFVLFSKYNVRSKNILEIGSFRGDSAKFLINYFANSRLTCVDSWTSYPELLHINFNSVEEEFDKFQEKHSSHVRKIKNTSKYFFLHQNAKFDLIYLDGSHFADDVITDLINSWAVLEVGGIVICDDYLWHYYTRVRDNPCAAINSFLMLKRGQYRLLAVYEQIWIQKLG